MLGGLLLGLGAALAWGLTDIAGALGGRRLGSLRVLVGTQVVGLASLLALAAIGASWGRPVPSLDAGTSLTALAAGSMAFVAYLSFFTALRIGPISVVSPIAAAYGGLTVVLAVVVRGESMTGLQAAGAAIATLGVILIGLALDGGRAPRIVGQGVVFAVVALVGFALSTITIAGPIRAVGWLPAVIVSRIANVGLALGLLAIVLRWRLTPLAPFVASGDGPVALPAPSLVLLAGLLDVAGLVSWAVGLEVSFVWIVGLASSCGPVVAVFVAVGFLGERPRPHQWIGLAALGLGLLLVGLP